MLNPMKQQQQSLEAILHENPERALECRRARKDTQTGKVTILPEYPLFHVPEDYVTYCQMLHRLLLVHHPIVKVPASRPANVAALIKANPAEEFIPRLIATLN